MGGNAEMTTKLKLNNKDARNEHGLKNLVIYYQKLFERKENLNHYSPEDYKRAKRHFVKYSLKSRTALGD